MSLLFYTMNSRLGFVANTCLCESTSGVWVAGCYSYLKAQGLKRSSGGGDLRCRPVCKYVPSSWQGNYELFVYSRKCVDGISFQTTPHVQIQARVAFLLGVKHSSRLRSETHSAVKPEQVKLQLDLFQTFLYATFLTKQPFSAYI